MRRNREVVIWVATVSMATLAGFRVMRAVPAAGSAPTPVVREVAAYAVEDSDQLAAAARDIIRLNPFRLERRPADVGYGQAYEPDPPPEPPPTRAIPAIVVTGIIGGPPWEAVLEGVPGMGRSVLAREGDAFGNLRILGVWPDSVIVQGADTTFTLIFERPWP